MKRLVILAIILSCLANLGLGNRRTRKSSQKIIQLTDPNLTGKLTFEEALAKRRSVREFSTKELKRSQIGQLAWAGQGVTDAQRGFRTAPSVEALYPMELYIATKDGLFTYQPNEHSLTELSDQDIRSELARTTLTPEPVAAAPCSIIIAGSSRTIAGRVGNRARTFVAMEAGHIAQNIQLQAVCMGLGSVPIGGLDPAAVRRVCMMSRGLEPLYVIAVGYPVGEVTEKGQVASGAKRAALIVPSLNFRDDELFTTKRMLDAAQIQTVIASTKLGTLRGALGGMADARVLVDQLRVDDYDAIVFISGPPEYVGNPVAINIVRETVRKGKVLGAIGVAPTILASADALTGIRATAFLSERDRLVQAGAIYTGLPVERERLIITATGATAAREFGRMIAQALTVK
ncbi:MAG: DJ-1/PfpI family protein [Phycisphaerales bacterium]|nr:MAG: DJ-1/PfpI family protein [Phycisphaerales bacterium]